MLIRHAGAVTSSPLVLTWKSRPAPPADDGLLVTAPCLDLLRCPDTAAGASGSLVWSRYIAYSI